MIGLKVLEWTLEAAIELNQEQRAFTSSVKDERTQLADETDREIREAAGEYERDTGKDKLDDIASEGAKGYDSSPSEEEIARATGEASPEVIAESARDTGEPERTVEIQVYETEGLPFGAKAAGTVKPDGEPLRGEVAGPEASGAARVQTPGVDQPQPSVKIAAVQGSGGAAESASGDVGDASQEMSPAMSLFQEEPQRIEIVAPNYKGEAPGAVFTQAKEWLLRHLVAIASGSFRDGSYPRLAPLFVQKGDPSFNMTVEQVNQMVREIRAEFGKLRFSGSNSGPDANEMLRFLKNGLDEDGGGMQDVVRRLLDRLKGGKNNSDSSLGLFNTDETPWAEGNPDEWQNQGY